jgi:hypothetical protein
MQNISVNLIIFKLEFDNAETLIVNKLLTIKLMAFQKCEKKAKERKCKQLFFVKQATSFLNNLLTIKAVNILNR